METELNVEREILAAHADRLNAGLRGTAAYPPLAWDPQQRALIPLMELAQLLAESLIIVEPSPAFIQKLGEELALAAARGQLPLLERYRKTILFGAATLGSTLSLLGLLRFYRERQRNAPESTPAN